MIRMPLPMSIRKYSREPGWRPPGPRWSIRDLSGIFKNVAETSPEQSDRMASTWKVFFVMRSFYLSGIRFHNAWEAFPRECIS